MTSDANFCIRIKVFRFDLDSSVTLDRHIEATASMCIFFANFQTDSIAKKLPNITLVSKNTSKCDFNKFLGLNKMKTSCRLICNKAIKPSRCGMAFYC